MCSDKTTENAGLENVGPSYSGDGGKRETSSALEVFHVMRYTNLRLLYFTLLYYGTPMVPVF